MGAMNMNNQPPQPYFGEQVNQPEHYFVAQNQGPSYKVY